ncbi:retrovirus-related pol polyprotein from transposon TNT 1-94 [Tanacetum coccineum]
MPVYPPNTPEKLVPRVFPTKSQVKINIYTLTQLFTEFDKTCKKRITPYGLTEGERGFKQTKECYLTEIIPFFKTVKEYFEGIQTALNKEVKEIFEQIEAEVDQIAMDKKCVEIERKNLLIENENLIADCLSNELLYSVMNVVNIVSRFSEMHDAYTVEQARNVEFDAKISKLKHKIKKDDHSEMIKHFSNHEVDHLNLQLKYQHLKDHFRNNKSQTSQDAPDFDSFFEINKLKEQLQGKDNTIRKLKNIKLKENVIALQEQNKLFRAENVIQGIAQLKGIMKCVTMKFVKPKVLAHDVEPIPPDNRNNREVYFDYLKHLKESVGTLREIVEKARIKKPLDHALEYACLYTKRSQELLEYVIGTCPKEFSNRDKKVATTPLTRKNQVTFMETCETSNNNTQKHVEQQKVQTTNVPVIPSTGLNSSTKASGSKPRSNTKKNRILPAKSDNEKNIEDHSRNNKSSLKKANRVDFSISSKRDAGLESNRKTVCQCWFIMESPQEESFTLGEQCPLIRFTKSKVVPLQKYEHVSSSKSVITKRFSNTSQKPLTRYKRRNKQEHAISTGRRYRPLVDSSCTKHMTGNRSRLRNFVKKFIGTVRFGNDHFGAIMGYGDYVIGDSGDLQVYYVEGLGQQSFFRSHGSNLYTISVEDMMKSFPICLLSKASKNKSWLWHRWLNHLNFGTIIDLARKDLVKGLPRLKFEKDHLCFACQLGKSKKYTHKPKSENTIMEVLHTLHIDLCGPMRVQSINGKKYILVIMDDYSRFTWVKFLRSKDETPEFVIKFLK